MAKEAIFSILQDELPEAAVLDLFAGSGQLGIEALSRGARRAVFVDRGRPALEAIRENLKTAGFENRGVVAGSDCMEYLRRCSDRFDIIIMDPPYGKDFIEEAVPLAAAVLYGSGCLVCETQRDEAMPAGAGNGFALFRQYRYGKSKITVYRQMQEE